MLKTDFIQVNKGDEEIAKFSRKWFTKALAKYSVKFDKRGIVKLTLSPYYKPTSARVLYHNNVPQEHFCDEIDSKTIIDILCNLFGEDNI